MGDSELFDRYLSVDTAPLAEPAARSRRAFLCIDDVEKSGRQSTDCCVRKAFHVAICLPPVAISLIVPPRSPPHNQKHVIAVVLVDRQLNAFAAFLCSAFRQRDTKSFQRRWVGTGLRGEFEPDVAGQF